MKKGENGLVLITAKMSKKYMLMLVIQNIKEKSDFTFLGKQIQKLDFFAYRLL